jgi:hypothetical protein
LCVASIAQFVEFPVFGFMEDRDPDGPVDQITGSSSGRLPEQAKDYKEGRMQGGTYEPSSGISPRIWFVFETFKVSPYHVVPSRRGSGLVIPTGLVRIRLDRGVVLHKLDDRNLNGKWMSLPSDTRRMIYYNDVAVRLAIRSIKTF